MKESVLQWLIGQVRKLTKVWRLTDTILKWIACAVTLAGALCTSLQIDPLNIWLLNGGALLYLVWSVRIREWSLVTINAGLLLIYIVGLIVRS
jgi:hypothetical protein